MNIVDPQFRGPVSQDVICFGPFRLSTAERLLEKTAFGFGLAAELSTFLSLSSSTRNAPATQSTATPIAPNRMTTPAVVNGRLLVVSPD